MKSFVASVLLFLAVCIASADSISTNGVFYVDNAVECHLIAQNGTVTTNNLTAGKTYMVGDVLLELQNGEKTTYYFSGGPLIECSPSSVLSINLFDQEVNNLLEQPRKASFGSHNLGITLDKGEFSIVYPSTNLQSSFTINTPFATYEVSNGKYFVRVSDKSSIAYTLEGIMQVHGEKNRTEKTSKGNLAVAIPFSDPGTGVEDKILTSIKTLKQEENDRYASPILLAEKKAANVGFIVVGGRVIGVWLK